MVVRAVIEQQSAWVVEQGRLKGSKAYSHHNEHLPARDVLSPLHVWKGDGVGFLRWTESGHSYGEAQTSQRSSHTLFAHQSQNQTRAF